MNLDLIVNSHRKQKVCWSLLLFLPLILPACGSTDENDLRTQELVQTDIEYIEPDEENRRSLAAAVSGNTPLVFTTQLFPLDDQGKLVGENDLFLQAEQLIENLETALNAAGSSLHSLVRLHVYLTDDPQAVEIQNALRRLLPETARPALSFATGRPVREGVLISLDAIAAASRSPESSHRVAHVRSEELYGPEYQAHATLVNPGRKIFIAGQAEMDETLADATEATLRGLLATLAYAGASAEDIIHVKTFLQPVDEAEIAEQTIASFFRGSLSPPVVSVEWQHESLPTEIELIAAAPDDPHTEEQVSHYAPVWMEQAPTFSRMVDVHEGGLLFTSSLYGTEDQSGDEQAGEIFNTLSRILDAAGSDYDHLVKATYYPSTDEGRQGLLNVRPDFYNPERPPAASLVEVRGTGSQTRDLNIDMIGALPSSR